MSLLPLISDEDLLKQTKKLLDAAINGEDRVNTDPYRNIIDPFSALVDASRQKITMSEWMKQEKARQIQKSFQNAMGEFHQGILGSLTGWIDLETGGIADVRNDKQRIVAEVKNKYNTTKGNHKREIYDDLKSLLESSHKGYTGYYVEVIPKVKKPYNIPYQPPDNRSHTRMPARDDIRRIDGYSFYALATGTDNALELLYRALPIAIAKVMGIDPKLIVEDQEFTNLFTKAYPRAITK